MTRRPARGSKRHEPTAARVVNRHLDDAELLRERDSVQAALALLVGDTLLTFMRESRRDWVRWLPRFIEEIRSRYTRNEIAQYFAQVRRVGPLACQRLDEPGWADLAPHLGRGGVVCAAEDVVLLHQARELLLGPEA